MDAARLFVFVFADLGANRVSYWWIVTCYVIWLKQISLTISSTVIYIINNIWNVIYVRLLRNFVIYGNGKYCLLLINLYVFISSVYFITKQSN